MIASGTMRGSGIAVRSGGRSASWASMPRSSRCTVPVPGSRFPPLAHVQDQRHSRGQRLPRVRLSLQLASPASGELVVLRAPVVVGCPPLGADPPASLQPVERRVQRPLGDLERALETSRIRSEIAHPCMGPSETAFRISRSSVPCGRSSFCSSTGFPLSLLQEDAKLHVEVQGVIGTTANAEDADASDAENAGGSRGQGDQGIKGSEPLKPSFQGL